MVIWQLLFFHFGAADFPSKIPYLKCFKIVAFPLWRRDPGFGAAICVAVVRNSLVLCQGSSQWNGCVKVPRHCGCVRNCWLRGVSLIVIFVMAAWRLRMVIWQLLFSHFAAGDFP